jgi:tetratricopeptide (TPR) repeat protein
MSQGKLDLALEELDKAFTLNPRNPAILFNRGLALYFLDDIDAAGIDFNKLLESKSPVGLIIGNLGMLLLANLQGKYSDAIQYSEKAIAACRSFDQAGWEFNFLIYLGDLFRDLGRLEEALAQYDLAWQNAVARNDLGQQRRLLISKGIYFLRKNSIPEALEIAEELKKAIESWLNPKVMRGYHYLMALIEIENENYASAVQLLVEARNLLPAQYNYFSPHSEYAFALGQAQLKLGELDSACSAFSEVISLTSGRAFNVDAYVLAYYELGKIFQAQGSKAEAVKNFEKFLDLRKNADPSIGELDDARKRLNILR